MDVNDELRRFRPTAEFLFFCSSNCDLKVVSSSVGEMCVWRYVTYGTQGYIGIRASVLIKGIFTDYVYTEGWGILETWLLPLTRLSSVRWDIGRFRCLPLHPLHYCRHYISDRCRGNARYGTFKAVRDRRATRPCTLRLRCCRLRPVDRGRARSRFHLSARSWTIDRRRSSWL